MTHVRRRSHDFAWLSVVGVLLGLSVAACASSAASFNPAGACGLDGRAAGAYPDLEARLPTVLGNSAAQSVDSGRNCSADSLGSLIAHGATGVEFAGATWDLGGGTAVTSAVFRLPDRELPAEWISEFYEIGARTAKRTENIETSHPVIGGVGQTFRLDTLNDLSLQSIVVWQDGRLVRVVLAATPVSPAATRAAHDDLVARAVAATLAAAAR